MRKLITCMAMLCICLLVAAQERVVTGKVTSTADGTPLQSVSIAVKGTTVSTISNSNGEFSIPVPPSGKVLVFSFSGMTTKEVTLGSSTILQVDLAADSKLLSEVVVTGVGVATDKKKLAISVESVSGANLPRTSSASVDQALIGKIPGAQITSKSGTPGAEVNILLRGINTLNRGTSPMILLDGVQVGSTGLQQIDLNSIDRVEVVQGAAAATIYGAQGANGVIQLFTKKGKKGKISVEASSSISNNTYLNVGGLSKARYHAFVTDASNNVIGSSGNPLVFDQDNGVYRENVQYNSIDPTATNSKAYNANLQYHDHFDYFFKPANTFNNSIALSGASDKIDFALAASNSHQESNIINNGYWDRTNLTANIGVNIAKGLTFRSITQLVYTKNTIKTSDRTIVYALLNAYPFADFSQTTTDGSIPLNFNQTIGINASNPSYWQHYTHNNDNLVDVIQNFNLNYKVNRFLTLDTKYGLNFQSQNRDLEFSNQSQNANIKYWLTQNTARYISNYASDNAGDLTKYANSKMFQNSITTATLRLDLEDVLGIKLPIVSTTQGLFDYRKQVVKEYTSAAMGLPAAYEPYNAANTASWRVYRDYEEPFVTYGYMVNQRFEYADFAGISAGFRSDYSSAFGRGSKPFTFPRGDAFLRISSMPFFKNLSLANTVAEFKIRAAYGQAGIQPKPFDRYVTISPTTMGSSTAFYYYYGQSNPDLGVEVSEETEIGTDLLLTPGKSSSFWFNTIGLSATYWNRKTKDAIYPVDVAPTIGLGTLIDNAFTLGSNGIQLSLNASVYSKPNFTWNATVNFGKQTSKILSIKGNQEVIILSSAGSTNYVLKAGDKVGQLYGFRMLHSLDDVDESGNRYLPEGQKDNYTVASNGYVVNKTTKQPFLSAGKYSFGDPNPKFNMSLINDFTFKDYVMFGFQFDWVHGSHLYNQTKEWMYRDGIHADYAVPFSIDGQEGAWTAFYRGVYAQRTANGTKDYFYEDASFLRLRNISIGFDFAKAFKFRFMNKLQLVLSGRNLWTATKYTGFDPEISSGTTNSAWDRGTDHSTMPNFKTYQAAINIGF